MKAINNHHTPWNVLQLSMILLSRLSNRKMGCIEQWCDSYILADYVRLQQ